jgi:hypothetical protein
MRVERIETQIITIDIVYPNNIIMAVIFNKTDELAFNVLPKINKVGYDLGFSTESEGTLFNETTFASWLENANNGDDIYAIYTLNIGTVSGNIIGVWECEAIQGESTLNLTIEFNTNGTYIYTVEIDGEMNCKFTGIYEFSDGEISILSVESNMEYQFVSASDFNFVLKVNELTATLFIINGLQVESGEVNLFIK